jgi:signal transduction histidine kinase
MRARLITLMLRPVTPPLWLGLVVAAAFIVAETGIIILLKHFAPMSAFGVLYVLGVLLVSTVWGFGLAAATSVASAVAFDNFRDWPVRLAWGADDWAVIGVFVLVALVANTLAYLARTRAVEADQRRREAELSREELRMLAGELTASRARIVSAGDEARRRFERDLHDGAQQRLVSLGMNLRSAQDLLPPDLEDLHRQMADIVDGLVGVSKDLQDISRGIHPAVLSRGGLAPALKTLARRSAVPVELRLGVDRRLPDCAEVAAYYVVAESLTNAAKHAQASGVTVEVEADADDLRLAIHDDGSGGADSRRGSGLLGLRDRVEALGGHLFVSSPIGSGTSLTATIPLRVN